MRWSARQTADVSRPPASTDLPICVDLDGTLIASDTLFESMLGALRWWDTPARLIGWLVRGRAYAKERLAERGPVDPAFLPYNQRLLAYLRAQREAGRRIVLATAAHRTIAARIAAHLGLFDEVVSSDGRQNLKGPVKAAALVQRFGEKGFVYAGNSKADLTVWRHAASGILVNVPRTIARAAARVTGIEANMDARPSRARAAVRAIRPHQWVKNLLVFVPMITANAIFEPGAWIGAALIFVAFSATASGIYVINDLTDVDADRRHPRKRARPFASGALPIAAGPALALALLSTGFGIAAALGHWHIIALYAACSVAYSLSLKALPLVDIFTLAILYTLRLFGGGEVTGHRVSMWLLAFSSFLFLALAIIKRVGELIDLSRRTTAGADRRGYLSGDVSILTMFGVSATFSSSIVLALYVQSREIVMPSAFPELMWAIVPLVLFWQCRLWLAAVRGYMHDDPIVYAARDWVSWIAATLGAGVFILASAWRILV